MAEDFGNDEIGLDDSLLLAMMLKKIYQESIWNLLLFSKFLKPQEDDNFVLSSLLENLEQLEGSIEQVTRIMKWLKADEKGEEKLAEALAKIQSDKELMDERMAVAISILEDIKKTYMNNKKFSDQKSGFKNSSSR